MFLTNNLNNNQNFRPSPPERQSPVLPHVYCNSFKVALVILLHEALYLNTVKK